MVSVRTLLWRLSEAWSPMVFMIAGGLLFVATAINGIDLFTPVATQKGTLLFIEGLSGFGGVVLSFVGLLGLYPRLADTEPRLARAGISLAVLPAAFFFTLLVVCTMLAPLLGFPSLKTLVPPLRLITETTLILYAVATTLFGVASLRSSGLPRIVGGSLLLVAVTWFGFFSALVIYQYEIPIWVTFVQSISLTVSLITIGYFLPSELEPAVPGELSTDPSV
ncbi:hypothetical protein BRC87_09235 [Halobacteriales archaeon QS_4_66_20]|nr:MAG: hypothetical protein BRC87_09235 [Halobacteriales archaeon QS_4_66_20]